MRDDAVMHPIHHPVRRLPGRALLRIVAGALAAAALLGVFLAYLRPAMALQLAQQLWSCF